MSHTYESPVETEVDLLDRIVFVCVNIKKIWQAHLHLNAVDIVRHF
jgi:hypothetical protein